MYGLFWNLLKIKTNSTKAERTVLHSRKQSLVEMCSVSLEYAVVLLEIPHDEE